MLRHPNIQSYYDQKHVEKIWGYEEWIANSPLYCGKKIVIRPGKKTSLHYHQIKIEHIYVASGVMDIYYDGVVWALHEGDSILIERNMKHCIQNNTTDNLILYEFSTEHFDSDSIRIPEDGY